MGRGRITWSMPVTAGHGENGKIDQAVHQAPSCAARDGRSPGFACSVPGSELGRKTNWVHQQQQCVAHVALSGPSCFAAQACHDAWFNTSLVLQADRRLIQPQLTAVSLPDFELASPHQWQRRWACDQGCRLLQRPCLGSWSWPAVPPPLQPDSKAS